MNKLKGFLLALQFLTKITLKRDIAATPQEIGRSGMWFPVVGLVLGLVLVGLNILLGPRLPEIVVSIILVLTLIALSGGLHLDGFIDSVDGLYAGATPQEVLEVMGDTKVGSMGVIALFGLLLLKTFSLNALDSPYKNAALLIMPVLGRWCMLYAASRYTYARQEAGLGQVFTQENNLQRFITASIFPIFVTLLLMRFMGVWLVLLVFFSAVGLAGILSKRIGGMTGDSLGAINEVMEVAVLLFLLLLVNK
jgi:adenosylcobinamide-GDP ribazoletransferase